MVNRSLRHSTDHGEMPYCPLEDCPGRYCGRIFTNNSNDSYCGSCPDGYRVDSGSSECLECNDDAVLRDYLYLGFVCLVCFAVRFAIIGATNVRRPISWAKFGIVALSMVENVLAMIFTLLVLEPQGSLGFKSCGATEVSDFYPIFFNPTRDYVHHIDCSYEVVYPLYRMVFIFFAFAFLHHLLLLPLHILLIVNPKRPLHSLTEFLWLMVFPAIVVVYAIFAGLLYFAFDYLTILVSVGSFIIVSTVAQVTKYGFKNPFKMYKSLVHWIFMLMCMLYLAYGIISLTEVGSVALRATVIVVAVTPPLLLPALSFFASPKQYLSAWGLESYRYFYEY